MVKNIPFYKLSISGLISLPSPKSYFTVDFRYNTGRTVNCCVIDSLFPPK